MPLAGTGDVREKQVSTIHSVCVAEAQMSTGTSRSNEIEEGRAFAQTATASLWSLDTDGLYCRKAVKDLVLGGSVMMC